MSNEDGLDLNKEQSFSVTRGQVEKKIDSELDIVSEETAMGEPSGRWSKVYELDQSLLTSWNDKPLMDPKDTFTEGPLRLEIAFVTEWTEIDDDGQHIQHPPLRYVSLSKKLKAPPGQRIEWGCRFNFYEGAGAVVNSYRTVFNDPIFHKPGTAMSEVIASSRPLSDERTETSIPHRGLQILKTCLENAHPLEKK